MSDDHPHPELLVHLCSRTEWDAALLAGEIRPASLREAGFVHLSTQQQVHLPANRIFAGRTDLVLLFIDRAALDPPLRWEPGVPGDPVSMVFPHLYGALPVHAVRAVRTYRPGPDGTFPALIPRAGDIPRSGD